MSEVPVGMTWKHYKLERGKALYVFFFFIRVDLLQESKCEVRIQFKESHRDPRLFKEDCPRNELVMRVSPHEAIYFKFNMKSPGLSHSVTTTELDLSYNHRYEDVYRPLAYTRLILSGVRGEQESFVRDDELIRAWEIFSPLLEKIEDGKKDTGPWTLMTDFSPFLNPRLSFFFLQRSFVDIACCFDVFWGTSSGN